MNNDMKLYYDYTISPLGKLFYKSVFSQLQWANGKKALDFGSGFGFTADYLANNNDVIALELDKSMIEHSKNTNNYKQINGDLDALANFDSESFDLITCHLVLEFVPQPQKIISELMRLLKKDGVLSIIRHNKNGRIIQATVQDYDLKDAQHLLNGGYSFSSAFGDIKYYENDDIILLCENKLKIKEVFAIRILASLHGSDIQNSENYVEHMFELEKNLFKNEDFIKIAYFNHILLTKI